jgi:hypothetical protein
MVAYPFPSAATEALVDSSTERLRRCYPISTPKDDTSRAEGYVLDKAPLALTTPLSHKPINPCERYRFEVDRMRQTLDPMTQESSCGFSVRCGS